jgi:hypothetical protein
MGVGGFANNGTVCQKYNSATNELMQLNRHNKRYQ